MKLNDFYFELPPERIAAFPAGKRDESRLMLVERRSGKITHHLFKDIIDIIGEQDFLVINNSRVIPARLFGKIGESRVEILVTAAVDQTTAEALTLPARKFKKGTEILLEPHGADSRARVIDSGRRGKRTLKFNKELSVIQEIGYAPLPPYIKRKFPDAEKFKQLDLERYQTVYAQRSGSIAAPTAGLHFTPDLFAAIKKKCEVVELTLAVGEATFQKIEVEDISQHRMGREHISIKKEDSEKIAALKRSKKLIAVGTTTVRALETYALKKTAEENFYSELFISPGFGFKMVDKLITNFHLPESSLFILVSAFAGLEIMKQAYRIAIEQRYRFFSYGDAMLII